jgi:hypothetical protein
VGEPIDLDDRRIPDRFENILKSCHRRPLGACIDQEHDLSEHSQHRDPFRLDQDQGGYWHIRRTYDKKGAADHRTVVRRVKAEV